MWVPALMLVVVAALIAAVPGFADPIASKQAQARQVLTEINQLDLSLGRAVEAYDAATVKLQGIHKQLSVNHFEMTVAKANLRAAEGRLAARLREIYISSGGDSTLEVILGSKNLDDVINRIDTANRVSDQDAQVLKEVKRYRRQVAVHGAVLQRARRTQQRVVSDRAAARARIANGLADRKRLLDSIKGEIQQLKAEEAA